MYKSFYLGTREEAILLGESQNHIGALALPIVLDVGVAASVGLAGQQLTLWTGHDPDLDEFVFLLLDYNVGVVGGIVKIVMKRKMVEKKVLQNFTL